MANDIRINGGYLDSMTLGQIVDYAKQPHVSPPFSCVCCWANRNVTIYRRYSGDVGLFKMECSTWMLAERID
jgi:hypothetical protein